MGRTDRSKSTFDAHVTENHSMYCAPGEAETLSTGVACVKYIGNSWFLQTRCVAISPEGNILEILPNFGDYILTRTIVWNSLNDYFVWQFKIGSV